MSEKLIIKNFGPIANVDLDLRKVNVLIGDQGTGKSTIAKLLWVLKNTAYNNCGPTIIAGKEITNETEIHKFKNDNFSDEFTQIVQKIELNNYFNIETYILFETDLCKIEITDTVINFLDKGLSKEKNTNLNYFIPAFREAYILLRNNYPAILNAKANLPTILNTFGQYFNNYREELNYFDFKNIIGVDYRYTNGNEFIVLKNGKEITFEESSSAVNSVVPLLVVFLGIVKDMSAERPRIYYYANCPFITIEEPELNCYPETQKKLIEFLIEKIKFRDNKKSKEYYYSNLLLTTHSPYILLTLNNLMYAFEMGKINTEEVEGKIQKKYWLNPNDVSVYQLLTDGTCENIMDEELKQIKVEKIDEISEVLSTQWHQLADLNFDK